MNQVVVTKEEDGFLTLFCPQSSPKRVRFKETQENDINVIDDTVTGLEINFTGTRRFLNHRRKVWMMQLPTNVEFVFTDQIAVEFRTLFNEAEEAVLV